MDLTKVLSQLHAELENIDAAIMSLERLQSAHRQGTAQQVLAQATETGRELAASLASQKRKRGTTPGK